MHLPLSNPAGVGGAVGGLKLGFHSAAESRLPCICVAGLEKRYGNRALGKKRVSV